MLRSIGVGVFSVLCIRTSLGYTTDTREKPLVERPRAREEPKVSPQKAERERGVTKEGRRVPKTHTKNLDTHKEPLKPQKSIDPL